jgi:hypothetical protein
MAGVLMTDPYYVRGRILSETDAVRLYSEATKLDPVDGQSYPPVDTGSNGLDVMKAAQAEGLITAYHHVFDFNALELALGWIGPAIAGTNWYDSMDKPDSHGRASISPDAVNRGGHEYEVLGIIPQNRMIWFCNSWGPDWGQKGCFQMSYADFERLQGEQGDVTVVGR